MTIATTTIRVTLAEEEERTAVESGGEGDERKPAVILPVSINDNWVPGEYQRRLTVQAEGTATVRVYHPVDAIPSVQVLDSGCRLAWKAMRRTTIRESLTWTGTDRAETSRHPSSGVSVISATSFRLANGGGAAARPRYLGEGRFVSAAGEVFGGLVVTYTTTYSEYLLTYSLSDPWFRWTVLRGDDGRIQRVIHGAQTDPVMVIARLGATLSDGMIPREIQWAAGFVAGVPATDDVRDYLEVDRETVVERIENPDDPTQYVEVERDLWVTFETPDGRLLTLRRLQ